MSQAAEKAETGAPERKRARFLYYRGEAPFLVSDSKLLADAGAACVEVGPEVDCSDLKQLVVRSGAVLERARLAPGNMRVAVVSDYGINCGIATYARYLSDELRKVVGELRIFAEDSPGLSPEEGVVRCWSRAGSYMGIVAAVREFNPDLVIVQHEFGLFHRIDQWSALMSQLSRWRTVVTLHTVLDHEVDDEATRLDYMTRALAEAACREVIVHTPRARQTLRSRGFSGAIHFIPHGCLPPSSAGRLPATKYGMFPEHSLFQYGFGGSHKGWEASLELVAALKPKYPGIFYTGVFNVSPFAQGGLADYHAKLLDLAAAKGLAENVAILRGFQSETMLETFLRSSRAALFLYKVPSPNWRSWGASGAIQLPMSLGVPLVLSDFPAFLEFDGKLPLCRSQEEAVALVDRILSDKAFEADLAAKERALSEARSWARVSGWYLACRPEQDFDAPC